MTHGAPACHLSAGSVVTEGPYGLQCHRADGREKRRCWRGEVSKDQAASGSGPHADVAGVTLNTEQGSAPPGTTAPGQKGDWRKWGNKSGSGFGEQSKSNFFSLLSLKKPGWFWPGQAEDQILNTCGLIGMVQGLHIVGLWKELDWESGGQDYGIYDYVLSIHLGSATSCTFSLILQASLQNREHCDSTCSRSRLCSWAVARLALEPKWVNFIDQVLSHGPHHCSGQYWIPCCALYLICCVTLDRSLSPHWRAREETSEPAWSNLDVLWFCNWSVHTLGLYNPKGLWTFSFKQRTGNQRCVR